MKNAIAGLFACVIAFAGVTFAIESKVDLTDIKCMMNGKGPAKADKSSEWKDGNVYFCCDNCKKGFDKDKKAHASKANHQLVATKQVEQQACPMSGGKLNAEHHVEFKGATVTFCCPNCKGAAEKMSDEDKLAKLFGEDAYAKAKFAKPEPKK